MIRAIRPLPPPNLVLEALNRVSVGSGLTELQEAHAYYSSVPPPTKTYDFRRYREIAVCQALTRLFHGKCAYCESPYVAVDALDVEHFRPKGGVSEVPTHPGYWWLAAEWTNLLPSCPPCNQYRRQTEYQPGMTLDEIQSALSSRPANATGKANAFPVAASNWVTSPGDDLTVEDPLLINPCERPPELFIDWIFERPATQPIWEANPVFPYARPKQMQGAPSPHGEASIGIFGLNRVGVLRSRIEQFKRIQGATLPIVDTLRELADPINAATPRQELLLERLARYKKNLNGYTHADQQYAGMARAYMREFEADLERIE